MASLAEQFLDDVDSSEDENITNVEESEQIPNSNNEKQHITDTKHSTKESIPRKLLENTKSLIEKVRNSSSQDVSLQNSLVSECTSVMALIDEEILLLHQHLLKVFNPCFPELETLILNPFDYARVAHLVVEEKDLTTMDLKTILPSGTAITVQMAASTSRGRSLQSEELETVYQLCNTFVLLEERRSELLQFVETRAESMAPNLVVIVGGAVAAALMGLAGGLKQLSIMPSCNVKVLGKAKKTLEGGSSATTRLHEGIIFTCPLVKSLPRKYRSKAGDIITGKAVLAARVDACESNKDGNMGRNLRQKLEEKFEKWQELPPAKTAKPLPIPGDETKRKHRGGRRARKEKERLGITEAHKLANRIKFGEEETRIGNDLENEGLGMLGTTGSQKLRIQTKKSVSINSAAKRKLDKQKKKQGKSEAEKLGITSIEDQLKEETLELKAKTAITSNIGLNFSKKNNSENSRYFSSSTPFHGVSTRDRQIKK